MSAKKMLTLFMQIDFLLILLSSDFSTIWDPVRLNCTLFFEDEPRLLFMGFY